MNKLNKILALAFLKIQTGLICNVLDMNKGFNFETLDSSKEIFNSGLKLK